MSGRPTDESGWRSGCIADRTRLEIIRRALRNMICLGLARRVVSVAHLR
jgi:hypothetical protein